MRRFVYLTVLSLVATLAFAPVATAQTIPQGTSLAYINSANPAPCSGAITALATKRGLSKSFVKDSITYVPDVGGCVVPAEAGTAPGLPVNALNAPVYDPNTGEELGMVKDLDPDLTGGANSTNYQEFCGTLVNSPQPPQQYYDQVANAKEQAILDPDGDGQACTAQDAAFLAGDTGGGGTSGSGAAGQQYGDAGGGSAASQQYGNAGGGSAADQQYGGAPGTPDGGGQQPQQPATSTSAGPSTSSTGECSSAAASGNLQKELGLGKSSLALHLRFIPDVGGCAFLPNSPQGMPIKVFNATVYDPDTGVKLGLVKDLDPDLTSGSDSTTYQEFCADFPAPKAFPTPNGATAQQYYAQVANAKEKAILDPDGDAQACTGEDTVFLAGDTGSGGADGDQQPQQPWQPFQQGSWMQPLLQLLPDTGGPAILLLAIGALLVAGGLVTFAIMRRR